MSCTVFALPYAIAWVVGVLVVGTAETVGSVRENTVMQDFERSACNDVHVINEKNFLEKSFETPFMDKEILLKTLEEHGVRSIQEDKYGKISGVVDSYTLTFEKIEADKPYFLKMDYLEGCSAEEKLNDISSEYALNVQEEAYLSIIEKLKLNNMQIEDEEVQDDNTIVLTINLD